MPGDQPGLLIDDAFRGRWDDLVSCFEDVSYDQTEVFSAMRWGAKRMSHLVVQQNGSITAGARVAVIAPPGLRKGLAYVRRGPVWRRQGERPNPDVYRAAVNGLKSEYGRRGHHLIIQPRCNPEFLDVEAQILREAGFGVLRKPADAVRYFVDLRLDPRQQMSSLFPAWRRHLKNAVSRPLEIHMSGREADLAAIMSLDGAPPDRGRLSRLRKFMRSAPAGLEPRIVLAHSEGRLVAGAAVALTGDTAQFLYGASDPARKHKAEFAIQWWLIDRLSRDGFTWYDLGGRWPGERFREFKRGLAGHKGKVVEANIEWEYQGSRAGRLVAETLFMARSIERAYTQSLRSYRSYISGIAALGC